MNFNKYHVSRNLFDINATPTKQSQSTIVTVDGQTITITGAWYIYYEIDVVPNTDYYVDWTIDYAEIQGRGTIAILTTSGQTITQQSAQPFSFNSGENQRIRLYIYSGNNDPSTVIISNIMVNEGSTPLPYEPYSSEVWHSISHYIHNTSTDTIATLPAVLYPTGTTATVGLEGQAVQSSAPSPTSPVMPQGTGERTGNLVRFYQEEMQGSFYGVDVTVKNAEITLNGTVTIGSGHWVEIGYKFGGGTESTDNVVIPCEPETPYTIATEILDGNSTQVRAIAFGASNENRTVNIGSSSTTTFSGDINRIFISLGAEGVVFNNLKFRVMFNKGSTALPYEPYGIKIPISSASTTTPIYLGEVESTRKIRKLVLTGEENLTTGNSCFILWLYSVHYPDPKQELIYCTHYKGRTPTYRDSLANGQCMITINQNQIAIKDLAYATVDDFKSYLAQQYAAGTPVCVWYVLATETTGIVNEPLMRIGDYADTLSNVSIPVTAGGDTLSVGTTVQPSEVTVNYKGWHPLANVHERDNGAWT